MYEDRLRTRFSLAMVAMPRAVKWLLAANIVMFIVQQLGNAFLQPMVVSGRLLLPVRIPRLEAFLALIPAWVVGKGWWWQIFTYMFLHGNLLHLLVNMLFLWVFGAELERVWGWRRLLSYYLTCGIGAGVFHLVFRLHSAVPVVGASGAVYGLLMAYGLLFPERVITLFLFFVLPIQIRAKYLVLLFGGMSLLGGIGSLFGSEGGIAHLAHLGGMVVGYFYLRRGWLFGNPLVRVRQWWRNRRVEAQQRRWEKMQRYRQRVDMLLDKINEVGYDNLTSREKKELKQASRYLTRK
ncbi:MAG: rhomboid family intramembrane serine protease [bacterium]|jgi:membrane associated rhomboid family serine protease|nr:rhomboid family intramembrane serine protease [candidate division KSB1 bacterium]MDH7559661.1 rhomboid family intramembrane serine protease [bacterium]